MQNRTDLAIELKENAVRCSGIRQSVRRIEQITVTEISVIDQEGSRNLGRPIGRYINIEVPDLTLQGGDMHTLEQTIIGCLSSFSFAKDNILVAGLGNRNITPDTLGPATADGILATRHLSKELRRQTGLATLKNVSVVLPGVLGQTGIETGEILKGIIKAADIQGLVIIDAFAAGDPARLGTTIQLCDTGISPGSGVGNNRKEISPATMGIPVIALGVPTCVDAVTLVRSLTDAPIQQSKTMIVTPREIDMLIDRCAAVLSRAINCFLQPDTDRDLLLSLV